VVEDQAARILALQQGDADSVVLDRAGLTQVQGSPACSSKTRPLTPELGWSSVAVEAVQLNQNVTIENNPNVGSGNSTVTVFQLIFSPMSTCASALTSLRLRRLRQPGVQVKALPLTMALPPSYLGYDPKSRPTAST
jgi:hypothetical protein